MLLPGRLAQTTLGDVLGRLLRARVSGVLALDDASGREHQVHLVGGAPRAVASDGPTVGELAGIDPELRRRAFHSQRGGDERLFGQLLRELGASAAAIEDAVARQCRERLAQLFTLRDARLTFHAALLDGQPGAAFVRAARAARGLDASEFLHGRPRSRDDGPPHPEDARREALGALGLRPHATAAEVRSAFKRRVLELHPDRAASEGERRERTVRLARLTALYQRALAD